MLQQRTLRCAGVDSASLLSRKARGMATRPLLQRPSDVAATRDVRQKAVEVATKVAVLSGPELTKVSNYASLVLQGYGKVAIAEKNGTRPPVQPTPKPEKVVSGLTAAIGARKRKAIISVLKMPGNDVVLVCEHGPDAIEVDSDQSLQVPADDIVGKGNLFSGLWAAVTGGRAMVHRNFAEAFQYILDNNSADGKKLQDIIGGVANGDVDRITCVGHGLGGAVATIAAYWCARSAFPEAEVNCVTYGAPCVGNAAFAKEFNSLLAKSGGSNWRLIHKMDALPAVPAGPEFKHAGSSVWLVQPGAPSLTISADTSAPYDAQLTDRDLSKNAVNNYVLNDNYMTRYQTALWSALGRSQELKDPADDSKVEEDTARLYDELQEFGKDDTIELMSVEDLQECFLYSQVAFLAYDDSFEAIDAKFAAWRPWMKEDLWGQVVHAQRLHASEKLNMITNTDTQAIIMLRKLANGKGEAIVGFRGTETSDPSRMLSDVMTDLSGFMIQLDAKNVIDSFPNKPEEVDKGVRVHKGFAYSFEDLINPTKTKSAMAWDRQQSMQDGKLVAGPVNQSTVKKPIDLLILDLAEQNGLKLEKITCVGHSLGAALSTLGAYYFKAAAVDEISSLPVDLINFGSPRVGNPKFVEAFNSCVNRKWRVMNRSDPVTMVAFPMPPVFDYEHVDDPILLCQPAKDPYGVPPGENGCPPVPPPPAEFSSGILRTDPPSKDPQNNKAELWGFQAQLRNRPVTLARSANVGRDHGMQHYQQGMNAALAAFGITKADGSPRNPLPLDTDGNLLTDKGVKIVFDEKKP